LNQKRRSHEDNRNMNNNLRILIVDDETDVCYLLNGMLKKRNFNIMFTHTLFGAEKALNSEIPSLVILDNKLPDGWGMDFIQFIKKNYPTVKIMMLTAHDSQKEKNKAYQNGADLFLSKPLNQEMINRSIDELIQV
jgi:two-component system, OmpR family, response regulator